MAGDRRVPGFLGRVLDGSGVPAGTCFQVAPGVLVTAAHVLTDLGVFEPGDVVSVDVLAEAAVGGSSPQPATVARVDVLHDLAVLRTAAPLQVSVPALAATDEVPLLTDVTVTGVAKVEDPGHEHVFLDATGRWQGGTMREDAIALGRMESPAIMRGMSGAPVRRLSDGVVVGSCRPATTPPTAGSATPHGSPGSKTSSRYLPGSPPSR